MRARWTLAGLLLLAACNNPAAHEPGHPTQQHAPLAPAPTPPTEEPAPAAPPPGAERAAAPEEQAAANPAGEPQVLACADHKPGDPCLIPVGDGDPLPGVCAIRPDSYLACSLRRVAEDPNRPPALEVCADKRVGDPCSFVFRGTERTGTCNMLPNGRRRCMSPEFLDAVLGACASKEDGATCSYTFEDERRQGTCRQRSDGKLMCASRSQVRPTP